MNKPIVSVIVPVYNVAPYLHRCLDSICSQIFDALEVILIDDGSTDGSADICDEYAGKDPRIRVVHQKNRGLSAARNKGLELASCDLVGFIDSDDWIEPDMYQVLYDNLLSADADISTCAHDRVSASEAVSCSPVIRGREEAMLAVLQEPSVWVYAWNKLYKKKLFSDIRYPEGRLYEDSYIILDLLGSVTRMVSTLAPKYHYTRRANSITGRAYRIEEEDRVLSAERNLELAKSKYPNLIPAAKMRYLSAHYICLQGILEEGARAYADKRREHCRALQKDFAFIISVQPKVFSFQPSASFFFKVLCPHLYAVLRKTTKQEKRIKNSGIK